jgi:hypothetical protein
VEYLLPSLAPQAVDFEKKDGLPRFQCFLVELTYCISFDRRLLFSIEAIGATSIFLCKSRIFVTKLDKSGIRRHEKLNLVDRPTF